MLKLLVINATLGRGSTGHIAEALATLARQQGWDTFAAHGSRYVGNSDMFTLQIGSKRDVLLHYLESRIFDRHGLGSKTATRKLIEEIDKIKPDVIHIHNIHGYYANYELLFRYLAEKGIPTVMTMHDFWLMTGHCAYINKSCEKWKIGCGSCPRLSEYPASLFDRSRKNWMLKKTLFGAFDKDKLIIVPVSYWLEGYAKQSLLKDCRFETIQNGVDTNLFKPYDEEHTNLYKSINWSKHTIITVADRWTKANGYNDIIELSCKLPDDMQIVMVGLTDDQMRGLPEKIVGIKHTENVNQLIELYSAADVLVNVSKEVTFGLVTAEAMACGTPAIVFKNTAGEEIINEDTGFAIEKIEEIPNLVYRCRESAKEYHTKCRNRIVEKFDSIKQYSKYITLYDNILNVSK